MCPPGLHLSLGIGLLLFNHLEQELECFDLQVATTLASAADDTMPTTASPEVTELIGLVRLLHAADEELTTLKAQEDQMKSWLIDVQLQLEKVPLRNSAIGQQILAVQQAASTLSLQVATKSAEILSLRERVKRGIPKGAGPCARQLEKRLKQLGVYRQAYFSGSFVGNHIDKMCKVSASVLILFNDITFVILSIVMIIL